jgi:predicted aminopeptidase
MSRLSLLVAAAALLLCGCETLRFYGQAVGGQVGIMTRARSNAAILADPGTPPELRERLELAERLRVFASERLALPGDAGYGRYADIGRPHLVWVIYAAPEFSLEPKTWSYPPVGRLDYRGYFREADAKAKAAALRAEGYDVCVGAVDAYSTLGWFHDPLLNTFIGYPEVDLAETLFHELTHHRVFHKGDTMFNECVANVVAEEGVQLWLAGQGRHAELNHYRQRLKRRAQFQQKIETARGRLTALYASGAGPATMRHEKRAILDDLRAGFRELHRRWGGRGLEFWLDGDLNNGHIVSVKLYTQLMPELRQQFAASGRDFDRFLRECENKAARAPSMSGAGG